MVNMGVPYARPDRALLTLRDEVYATYGYTPRRASEFVTGYKAPGNFTGHNADSNGIVHAVDIFTDDTGNLPEAQGRELAQKIVDEMKRRSLTRAYVIHDMSPGAPWPAIASYATGYEWVDYTGPEPHSDHIHVSMCDMYWGDPAPVPASVYDSTASWNLGAVNTQSGTITPIQEDLVPNAQDQVFTAIDGSKVSLEQLLNSLDRKLTAQAAAISGILAAKIPDPSDPGKSYSIADYIVWGATNAKAAAGSSGVAAGNTSPEALAKAITDGAARVDAQALADQLQINVKVADRG